MSGASSRHERPGRAPAPIVRALEGVLRRINAAALVLSMVAMFAACVVLTSGVVLRYFLHAPTDWQDEVAVFLLVFTTFGSSGWVQEQRAHIGIEALGSLLPDRANRVRGWLCDVVALSFCAFFSWKSWAMVREAWQEGMTTSSDWAPPLWFPYSLMAGGMSLLTLQLLLQVFAGTRRPGGPA